MDESSIDLRVEAARGETWVISVLEDCLVFRKTDGTRVQRISRSEAPRALEIVGLAISDKPLIAARVPTRVIFRLTRDQADVIRRWLSPLDDEYVRAIIKRYVVLASIPAGILYLVASAMTRIDAIRAASGLCLVAIGILGILRPKQGILLLNAVIWAIVAVLGALRAFHVQRWWLLLLVTLCVVGYGGLNIRIHRFIASLKGDTLNPVDRAHV